MTRALRPAPTVAGLALLAAVWLGPGAALAEASFTAHMARHMIVVAIASALLAAGLAGRRLDPVLRAPRLFAPIPASFLELAVVWAWHAPALHQAARHHPWALAAEQGSFLACGLLLWLSACGGTAVERRQRSGGGIVALLLTAMHMTLLGALLALAPRPLYAHAGEALADQHMGGAVMLLVGGIVYLAGGLWLAAGLARDGAPAARPGVPATMPRAPGSPP